MILKHKDRIREFGGPGSGHWGHLGIPGYHGGSQAGSGGVHARPDNYMEKKPSKTESSHQDKDILNVNDDVVPGSIKYATISQDLYNNSNPEMDAQIRSQYSTKYILKQIADIEDPQYADILDDSDRQALKEWKAALKYQQSNNKKVK